MRTGRSVSVEGADDLAAATDLERVAVLAHWSGSPRLTQVRDDDGDGARRGGIPRRRRQHVRVVGAARLAGIDRPTGLTVLRRPNIGYDFGSWATAIDRYPVIAEARRVLLLNDSLVGPFATIEPLLAKFHASAADVWAVTDTAQFEYHLQSYVLGFAGQTLREPPLQAFWRDIRVEALEGRRDLAL